MRAIFNSPRMEGPLAAIIGSPGRRLARLFPTALALATALGHAACGGGSTQAGGFGEDASSRNSPPVVHTPGDGAAAGTDGGTNTSAGTDGGTNTSSGPDGPALSPQLLMAAYLGGAGDQYVTEVSFDASGQVVAKAGTATLTYDVGAGKGTVSGDIGTAMDLSKFPTTYPLPKGGLSTNTLTDPRNGQTYTWGTHPNVAKSGTKSPAGCTSLGAGQTEVAPYLQMAFFKSSAGYKLWDFDWNGCLQVCAVADSRGYDAWLSANGKVGVMLWTDGGDTPLVQDPKDVSMKAAFLKDSFGEDPGGMGTLFAVIDPASGTVESGTWLATHTVFHTHDDWGRVYTSKAVAIRYGHSDTPNPTNPFGMSEKASSGLLVLRPDMKQPAFNAYLGGDPATCAKGSDGVQLFDAIALHDNILVLGGTTCVTDLAATDNAVQKTLGGGQDGFVAVVKLW